MNTDNKSDNNLTNNEEKDNNHTIVLTEENAPVIFRETAEADEDDIELIDLTTEKE